MRTELVTELVTELGTNPVSQVLTATNTAVARSPSEVTTGTHHDEIRCHPPHGNGHPGGGRAKNARIRLGAGLAPLAPLACIE